MKITGLVLLSVLALQGCASTLGAIGALSSAATPKVSASLQVGDKQTNVSGTTVGKTETSTQKATVKSITAAKKAEVDQSTKKTDKKTEIGEVAGSVTVNQGPDKLTLILLALGWPLFISFLVYVILRRIKNVGSPIDGASAPSNAGVKGTPEVLEDEVLQSLRLAAPVRNSLK